MDILIGSFSLNSFKDFLSRLSEIHVSELSIFEAKAKIFRLSKKNPIYTDALVSFGENLRLLREDEKFTFHSYNQIDDKYFNMISSKNPDLDSFDVIIVAQAADVGLLITEDREILCLKERKTFADDHVLNRLEIKRWVDLSKNA